ncbi:HAD family hydrolase [Paenacidovorax monticola]|uniref:phosphoserine phosphatase n=1 Tax=Paenacidovorax monticola TaxID=1926868 RepID=A0A7H0HF42_9BURK|nr:HAD family hydrolase [Paenacidovorax monticola]QNP59158.1 haloacid dehalogenase-like hydrolase [Paenacidovorax monticola]
MQRRLFLLSTLPAALAAAGCAGMPSIAGPLPGHWDTFNREQIEALIASQGKGRPGYNAAKPPYAVFDWDNTSVFLDIEEAALIYQLENLVFGATPAQLETAIRRNIPTTPFLPAHRNAAGQPVNIDAIAPDIVASYAWLYENYAGLKGSQPLEAVKKSPHYAAFITKVRYLYEAIGDTFDHDTAYPWVTYLFAGMTEAQVRALTVKTVRWQLGQPIGKVKWTSPAELPGRAGVVSVSWKNGLRLQPEMQALYARFRNAGWDVWVCSASFVDVIREISSNPEFGYNNPAERVLAMELERDAQGRILPDYRHGYDQTQGPGKTKNIQRFLVTRYGYGPAFVAGDSEGDQNMMADFAETQKVLIVNRLRDPKTAIGRFSAQAVQDHGKPGARYLLQGRDDNTGQWVPSQLHTPLGASQGLALKK